MENMNPESLLRKAQALGDDIKEMESIDVMGAYRQTQAKIKTNKRKSMYNQLMRYAAFLTIPLLLTSLFFGYLYFGGTDEEEQYAEVTAATGSVIRYELPDHSVVWLNAGSTLRYPTVFRNNNRNVELKGEAYFEVQADKERPFYVNTLNGLKVYVYGTKFNVAAYDDDSYIETVLEKGKVNVITPNQETIVLAPGEQLLYDKQSQKSKKNTVDVYGKVAWKDGKLIFRNASLEEIFKRLERHFNVDIQFDNKAGKEYKYRATFRNETLSQILDYLAKSATLKWKIQESEQQTDGTLSKTKIIVDLY
ncbi:FecR family protein [Bacteroides sp. GM023]|uniref:FecR family protein n=1 Tax=Bacteroides sp. GM023 TaxID=2723058 RepID=UPI00168AF554|nr:FecR family protein [Bacteroides sp. GM023]MBD3591759.1 FecR family protein [Bacteroides sp. GM023]